MHSPASLEQVHLASRGSVSSQSFEQLILMRSYTVVIFIKLINIIYKESESGYSILY